MQRHKKLATVQSSGTHLTYLSSRISKILATLREIKNRQSAKFKDFSPRAIPPKTEA